MSNNRVLIEKITNLLNKNNLVFVHKDTGNLISIPEFDDFMDFGDNNYELQFIEIENNPDKYYQIKKHSSRELYNCMMDFAQETENEAHQRQLVKALRHNQGIDHFYEMINYLGSEVSEKWDEYYNERLRERIKEILVKERLRFA